MNQSSLAGNNDGLFTTLIAGQNINIGDDLSISIDSGASNNDSGINVATSDGDITIGGALDLTISADSGTIANRANINVSSGRDLSVGSLNATLDLASDQLTITNGANMVFSVGGEFFDYGRRCLQPAK